MNGYRLLRRAVAVSIATAAAAYIRLFWRPLNGRAVSHGLPGELAVTLTSYPPRFPTLALTLRSLLAQSVRPDRLYLWIAEADMSSLPPEVTRLQAHGVTIRPCEDTRSYKKIIPALASRKDEFLVIADDDVFYPRHWLRGLVRAYRPGLKEVPCTRAHRIRFDEQGRPLPYLRWESEVAAGEASPALFPTGVGGVLYEPNIFHPDVTRSDLFRALCPTTDDVWLYCMAALNGARFRKIGPRWRPITWVSSQTVALAVSNAAMGTANDEQITNMVARYGVPAAVDGGPAAQTVNRRSESG